MLISFAGHPKALLLLFLTEMWERFSYYGMRALLTLYLISAVSNGGLGWSNQEAASLYGMYTGLVYVTPLIGGYLSDRFLGNRISIAIGGILMMLGHISLAIHSMLFFYAGLVLLVLGNGFFKPNISSMVGQLYVTGSPLKDSAYTIFYMGINVGAFLGTLVCGYLGERLGWHYGFGAAGVGMFLGLVSFYLGKNWLGNIGLEPNPQIRKEQTNHEKLDSITLDRFKVIVMFSVFSIIFWLAFEQAGSSMNIFALNYTNRNIAFLQFEFPASWFQSVNPFLIFFFAPLLSFLWTYLDKTGKNPSGPTKFAIALFFLGAGFLVLVAGSWGIPKGALSAQVSIIWLLLAYLLHTIGELCLSPVGLSYVNKLAPQKYLGVLFGIWMFASAIGNSLGGFLAATIDHISKEASMAYFFLLFCALSWFTAILLIFMRKKMQKWMHGIL